jgi:adenosylcobinamide-phosphate synthase
MSLLVIISALLLAHYRPNSMSNRYSGVIRFFERKLNDGQFSHGLIAWLLAVLLPSLILLALYVVLKQSSSILAILLSVVVLYLVLDSVNFSATAETISRDLRDGNVPLARERLSRWSNKVTNEYGVAEVARVTIETALVRTHSGMLAPLFWFVLLGPAGAIFYRFAQLMQQTWQIEEGSLDQAPQRLFHWLDWLPAHVTAISFAVVGNFEDAMYCWRTQSEDWKNPTQGIMLASGAGALGVKLGDPLFVSGVLEYRPELGLGDVADADYVLSAVGLIWRALVLMLTLILLMTFANWLGK